MITFKNILDYFSVKKNRKRHKSFIGGRRKGEMCKCKTCKVFRETMPDGSIPEPCLRHNPHRKTMKNACDLYIRKKKK